MPLVKITWLNAMAERGWAFVADGDNRTITVLTPEGQFFGSLTY
jgi:hypothetical protein